jgi:hypothetical protein
MRRDLVLCLAIACGLLFAGCKKEEPTPPAADEKKAAPDEKKEGKKDEATDPLSKLAKKIEEKVAGAAGALVKDGKALTQEEYEKLLLDLAKCSFKETGIDWSCPEYKAYRESRNRNTAIKDLAGMSSTLGLKHMKHENPAVRYTAAGLLRSFFGSKPETQDAVIKAAPEEKNPVVLAALIAAVGSSMKQNPKVAELVLKMVDHEAEQVRIESLGWLTSSWGRGVEGAVDKVLEKLQKDPSVKVQRVACENAGKTGDKRLLAIYKKMTQKPEENPDLYSSCMRGLLDMWNPFMSGDVPASVDAYKLTMNRLRDKPRSKNRPPWIIMSNFGRTPKGETPWYKQAEVVKALADIALDGNAHWMARTACCRALGELKAQKELTAIKTKLAAKTDFDDKNVVKAADEAIAKIK